MTAPALTDPRFSFEGGVWYCIRCGMSARWAGSDYTCVNPRCGDQPLRRVSAMDSMGGTP